MSAETTREVIIWEDLPNGWQVKKLKHISLVQLSNVDKHTVDGQKPVLLCNYVDVYKNEKITSAIPFMQATATDEQISRLSIQKDDVLFTKDSETPEDIGVPALVDEDLEGVVCGYHLAMARPDAKLVFGNYLLRVLQSEPIKKYFFIKAAGMTRYGLDKQSISEVPIPLPSVKEQRAIADYLDRETARLDSLIAAKERLLELLAEKRRAVITHAVTRGLNGDVSLQDSGVEWLGEIPHHWKTVGFTKYLDSWIDYRGHTPEKTVSGVFLVTARNIRNGKIDYEISKEYVSYDNYDDVMSRGKPKIGDLLLTMEAPLGQTALIDREDVALAQRVIKLDYNKQVLLNEFVMYWIMSNAFQSHIYSWATGSTALGIKASKLSELINVIPPIEEQKEIIDYIKHQEEQINKLVSAIGRTMLLLYERRDSLIAAAVSGQIKVV